METVKRNDEALLAGLGYRQEFKRSFTPFEVFGVGFSIIGLFPLSRASVLVYAIPNGGAVAMVWGWATCAFFLTFIALAMAELGSAAPTSGGLYYWTFMFSSPRWRTLLAWIVGYSNTIGNLSAVASVDWGCAVQIMAAVSIGSGLSFAPTTAQTFGVYVALLVCHGSICSLAPKVIARLQTVYVVLNVLLCLVIIIGLPSATPHEFRNSAKYAFGSFENVDGWPNGYAFILSFLAPLWTIGGFDASVHISEEATNASVAVPWAIIYSTTSGSVLGWAINVALAFSMGTDLESIIDSPIGQPMASILFNVFGQRGTLTIWAFVVIIQFMMGTSILTAASRQSFAFSRDGGLPFSDVLYRVSARTGAPVNSVWFTVFNALLLGLLSFAGPSAIGAVFSLAVTAQFISYSIAISARFLGGKEFRPGPFTLGIFSPIVAVIAVAWMIFTTVVFLFPTSPNPSAPDMNWTVVVLGGVITLSVVYFYFPLYGGVYWFTGPIANIGHGVHAQDSVFQEPSEKQDDKGSVLAVNVEVTSSL
ncbi:hypothetical protein PLICRDRAFT_117614 [Plicaturopsis crispa FD-325 SS-3]|uniref:APC amino acid permease n=1 Tax=Plicaturopsis crispa FD-325 SS-3 TaxID=944288 RepID=A0A0C9T590_PLICR|nr:hypothetical protein PLICRDRAFT_117614 [Plicaturopsis crispa FD-325 SS-3]